MYANRIKNVTMFKLHENFFLRKCFFKREQVPTQTVMKNKMTDPLANVYFKDMSYKLKVLAGLEPVLRGCGNDWFVAPADILKGEVSLKPLKKEYLSKLKYTGIDALSERLVADHLRRLELEKQKALEDSDEKWKRIVKEECEEQWYISSEEEAARNTSKICTAISQFEQIYSHSITNMESMILDSSIKSIEDIRTEAYLKMKAYYHKLLKDQAKILYTRYQLRLDKEKAKRKVRFMRTVDKNRKRTWLTLHDINYEKHKAIEKLRHFLECQNLACQVYVALKEREACDKQIYEMTAKHGRTVKKVTEEITFTNLEITLAKEREQKRQELNKIWQIKVCHVFKKFQTFVSYCLHQLPEHADFFINMEKLMLLQINDAMEDPSCESLFEEDEEEEYQPPTPASGAKPFVIYGDLKPRIVNEKLLEKGNALAEVPVFVMNKNYVYAACDNMQKFSTKMRDFIQGRPGYDVDVQDNFNYSYSMPVKRTISTAIAELKLESSLMQVLQDEIVNVNKVNTDCCICKVKHCFCSPLRASQLSFQVKSDVPSPVVKKVVDEGQKITSRSVELKHERKPQIPDYASYVTPKICKCPKRAKNQLADHLPPYMMNVSQFEPPQIPHYEPCSVTDLRRLVAQYRGVTPIEKPVVVDSKSKEIGLQYSDQEFDELCTCYDYAEIDKLYREIIEGSKMFDVELNKDRFDLVGGSMSHSHLTRSSKSFATERAFELKNLIDPSPELQEIFKSEDCKL